MLNDWLFRRMMSAPVTPSGDGVNLPTLFQRVEYLQGSANAYINTGYYPNENTEIYLRGGWVNNYADNPLFGVDAGSYTNTAFTCATTVQNRVVLVIEGYANTQYLFSVDAIVDIYLNKNEYSFDGVSTPVGKNISFTSQFPLHLLGWDRSGNNILCGSGRICKCQISESGVLIHDLYPCYRKSDNKPGMYDLVTRQFFTNANATGNDFTVGPDIPSTSPYIVFVDPAVEAICVQIFSSDGIGVTMQDAAAVKTFNGNLSGANDTTATKFNEMVYFTGLGTGADPDYCTNSLFFSGLKAVTETTLPPTLRYVSQSTFRSSAFTSIEIPASVEYINSLAFANAGLLSAIIMRPTTPPSLYANAIQGNAAGLKIYVPYSADHSILTAYQTASNWSLHASKMVELNPDGTIPTT